MNFYFRTLNRAGTRVSRIELRYAYFVMADNCKEKWTFWSKTDLALITLESSLLQKLQPTKMEKAKYRFSELHLGELILPYELVPFPYAAEKTALQIFQVVPKPIGAVGMFLRTLRGNWNAAPPTDNWNAEE